MELPGRHAIACGYARLPSATAAGQVYQTVVMVARVDRDTDVVQKASITLVTPVAREWVEEVLVGSNLRTDQEAVLREFDFNYGGGALKAIKQAYRDLCERYGEMKMADAGT
ncbi:MAG: hypothetical protein Kow00129_06110 [Thermoleophilia bacterium]